MEPVLEINNRNDNRGRPYPIIPSRIGLEASLYPAFLK